MYYGVFEAIGDENGRWQIAQMAARHTVDFVFSKQDMAVQWQKEIRHILTKVRRVSQKSELKLADKLAS